MTAFGRGALAAALAAAMAVAPSVAQEAGLAGKPVNRPTTARPEAEPDVATRAYDYSKSHPVVAIAIAKGRKDAISGEKIGATLSAALMKLHGVPSTYFVAPGDDYTAVGFAVQGSFYGPYGLKESLSGLSVAADSYNERVKPFASPAETSGLAGKPEPLEQ